MSAWTRIASWRYCGPEDLGGEYPAIQYVPPDGGFAIDLLARLGADAARLKAQFGLEED